MRSAARRLSILASACVALVAPLAHAGPWGPGQGHLYAKVSYGHLRSTELANPDGSLVEIPRFVKQEVYLYGALGLTPRLTAIASFPLVRSSDLEDFRRESGVGDVQFGLQYELGRRGPWTLALRGLAQAPTGDETLAEGLLPTGSGVWEGELRLSAGRSFAGGRLYGFVEAGHLARELLRDALVYDAQLGWNASPRLVLAFGVRGVETWDKSARDVAIGSPVGVGDRVTYLAFGPTAIVKLGGGFSAQLDVSGQTRARNLAKGPHVSVGVSYAR